MLHAITDSIRPHLADPAAAWLADFGLRSLIWLLLAALGARLARTASARHLAWTAGLVGVLLLPAVAHLVPAWTWSLLPATSTTVAPPHAIPTDGTHDSVAPPIAGTSTTGTGVATPGVQAPNAAAGHHEPVTRAAQAPSPNAAQRPARSVGPGLVTVWLAGAVLLMLGVLGDAWRRIGLVRRGRALDDEALRGTIADAVATTDTRAPRVLINDEVQVPMTWGLRRPVLVLPSAILDWPAARRRHVILHELAHIHRGDARFFLMTQLACAVAWFQPLVWWAARRQRWESELACDDQVIAAGVRPSSYAEDLVSIARRLRPALPSAAASFARRRGLGARVRAILDDDRNRTAPSRTKIVAALAVTCMVALPVVASVEPAPRDGDAPSTPQPPTAAPQPPAPAPAARVPAAPRVAQVPARPRVARVPAGRADGPGVPGVPSVPGVPDVPGVPSAPAAPVSAAFVRACGSDWSTHSRVDNDDWQVTIKAGRCRFELEMEGDVEFLADESGIARMARGATFEVDERMPGIRRTLEASPGADGTPTYTWKIDGDTQPFDAEAEAWLAELIPRIFRATGLQAEARTQRLLERGGVEAVFGEIGLLTSDYVRRRYFSALIGATELRADQMVRWLRLAGNSIASDYELAETLRGVPARGLERDDAQLALVEAGRTIQSDYELRRVLTPLVERDTVSASALEVMMELAQDIESDFELASLLVLLIDHHRSLEAPGVQRALVQAARTIESDYELKRTLVAALDHQLDADVLASLLEVAVEIESDFELASVLIEAARRQEVTGPARSAWERALASIGSRYEHDRARRALGS